ncbi:MAG: LysM peptidoglycan-binding domain-containing protein [Planctomycetota bacterium]
MRRNAVTLLASLFLVSMLSGCSLFGGKKKDAMAEDYNPSAETSVPAETYPAYPSSGGYTGGTTGSRYHTVQKKETLYALARQYYNDQSRWKDIYEANRAELGDPNRIRVGQRLVIP